MFERFTDRARRVVVLAQEEARMLNHNYIGTEHILLGLIHEGYHWGGTAKTELDVIRIGDVLALTVPARLVVGSLLDRFGPRRTFSAILLYALIPCLVFATAQNFTMLVVARLLTGVVGAGFVVGIRMVSEWFDPAEVGTAEGVYGGWGNFGAAAATYHVDSDTQISATVPAAAPAKGKIKVTTPAGTATSATAPSSPTVSTIPAIVACQKNSVCTFPLPASDPDSDPVTFRLSTSNEAGGLISSGFSGFIQPGPLPAEFLSEVGRILTHPERDWSTPVKLPE